MPKHIYTLSSYLLFTRAVKTYCTKPVTIISHYFWSLTVIKNEWVFVAVSCWGNLKLLLEHRNWNLEQRIWKGSDTIFFFLPVWYQTTHTVNGLKRWVLCYLHSSLYQTSNFHLFSQIYILYCHFVSCYVL